MSQPVWKFIGNLGDLHPLDHDGFFVYEDTTGVYTPEAEAVRRDDDSDDPFYTVYRFDLDRCTYINGVLSDNKFHPDMPVWFAHPESEKMARPRDSTYLSHVSDNCGESVEDLIRMFCSEDVLERAEAYRAVAEYHGYDEFDHYPLTLRRRELRNRYLAQNGEDYGKRCR